MPTDSVGSLENGDEKTERIYVHLSNALPVTRNVSSAKHPDVATTAGENT